MHVLCFLQVFFIWVTRSQKQWEWFTDIIKDVEDADTKGLVENHIFITQFFDKFDLRTTMLVSKYSYAELLTYRHVPFFSLF